MDAGKTVRTATGKTMPSHTTSQGGPTARERRWLWAAWILAGLVVYPLPLIRSGAVEIFLIFFAATSDFIGTLVVVGFVPAMFLCAWLGVFLLWSLPHFERHGLPRRSLVLLVSLVIYLPVQFIVQPRLFSEDNFGLIQGLDTEVAEIWLIRHLDKPLLGLLAVMTLCGHRNMNSRSQLVFHFLLAFCFSWALFDLVDMGFGSLLLKASAS